MGAYRNGRLCETRRPFPCISEVRTATSSLPVPWLRAWLVPLRRPSQPVPWLLQPWPVRRSSPPAPWLVLQAVSPQLWLLWLSCLCRRLGRRSLGGLLRWGARQRLGSGHGRNPRRRLDCNSGGRRGRDGRCRRDWLWGWLGRDGEPLCQGRQRLDLGRTGLDAGGLRWVGGLPLRGVVEHLGEQRLGVVGRHQRAAAEVIHHIARALRAQIVIADGRAHDVPQRVRHLVASLDLDFVGALRHLGDGVPDISAAVTWAALGWGRRSRRPFDRSGRVGSHERCGR
jgi:hypothetical protein